MPGQDGGDCAAFVSTGEIKLIFRLIGEEMPDEPNKKIDETLRAYAQERRKAADISLHPATRNLLQGEVRRVFGAPEPQPWWKRLRAFWPQLTFAGSMCL